MWALSIWMENLNNKTWVRRNTFHLSVKRYKNKFLAFLRVKSIKQVCAKRPKMWAVKIRVKICRFPPKNKSQLYIPTQKMERYVEVVGKGEFWANLRGCKILEQSAEAKNLER